MKAPQIILIILLSIEFTTNCFKHGETKQYHVGWKIADIVGLVGLLYWGGFWN